MSHNSNRLQTHDTAIDNSGSDRLRLVFITRSESGSESEGSDFDSLVWERQKNGSWGEHLRITAEQFNSSTDRERWAVELHSFDAMTGTAVIRMAEGDVPRDSKTINYVYSWRRWDLNTNRQKEFYYTCQPGELFEPFNPKQ